MNVGLLSPLRVQDLAFLVLPQADGKLFPPLLEVFLRVVHVELVLAQETLFSPLYLLLEFCFVYFEFLAC